MATRILNDGYYVDGSTGEVVPVAANATIMTQEEREARKGQVQQIKTLSYPSPQSSGRLS